MGVDDLRVFVCGRAGDFRDGVDDRSDVAFGRFGAVQGDHQEAAPARSGEAAVRLQHAVGVLRVFAIVDYLVGEPAGRDYVLPFAAERAMGRGGGDCAAVQLRGSVSAAAVAGRQAHGRGGFEDRGVDDIHAAGGFVLDDATGIYFAGVADVAGYRGARCANWFVDGI